MVWFEDDKFKQIIICRQGKCIDLYYREELVNRDEDIESYFDCRVRV